ncbi:MAG: hypothetical protein A2Z97_00095 [Bdellovibrionales bacterium GWB1_52_6]|nr:MAG: hypothetical protein A2Z97_00095 [Bdellovibrionales bacterium GWB1_52_6]OFZ04110.1 MAG: hypothetical protein A2X97_15020 [Bdellovibrionales bacterium GWA1_52_35]HCM39803.1 YbhB/YbcL family Raf kinase inhibitor-like protein [Bdellovibrionales bacterium]
MSQFLLSTDAIFNNGEFDPRYTCDLDNSSPEIRWEGEPAGTQAFALIVDDVGRSLSDAAESGFTHWLIYMISAHLHHLPAGVPPQDALPNGIRQGLNDFKKLGYAGPCPPFGEAPHSYRFRLFALGTAVELPSRLNRAGLLQTIEPYILQSTDFLGRYQRSIRKAG